MMEELITLRRLIYWDFGRRIVRRVWRYSPRADQGRGAPGARPPPLKLEKIRFFCVKSWFFTRNTPKMFAPPSVIGKNMIFWRKIVIFHTKYPNKFRASLRSVQFFYVCPPLTWNPGSAPALEMKCTNVYFKQGLAKKKMTQK
jgi:hypothetical protein